MLSSGFCAPEISQMCQCRVRNPVLGTVLSSQVEQDQQILYMALLQI